MRAFVVKTVEAQPSPVEGVCLKTHSTGKNNRKKTRVPGGARVCPDSAHPAGGTRTPLDKEPERTSFRLEDPGVPSTENNGRWCACVDVQHVLELRNGPVRTLPRRRRPRGSRVGRRQGDMRLRLGGKDDVHPDARILGLRHLWVLRFGDPRVKHQRIAWKEHEFRRSHYRPFFYTTCSVDAWDQQCQKLLWMQTWNCKTWTRSPIVLAILPAFAHVLRRAARGVVPLDHGEMDSSMQICVA